MSKEEEIEAQREILHEVAKNIIKRIKKLQLLLKEQKTERRVLGGYDDCGDFYKDEVIRTEAKIEVLISQKISIQKWRKQLKYS